VMASICSSFTTAIRPMELKISRAIRMSSSVACRPAASAVMPWRMRQGVFGMALTTRAARPNSRSIKAVVTEAATEMSNASCRRTFLISCKTPFTCWGFKQTSTRSAPETA